MVGGENKRQKAAGGLEPAEVRREHGVVRRQERSRAALPLTQSPYSSPTLVPRFVIECQDFDAEGNELECWSQPWANFELVAKLQFCRQIQIRVDLQSIDCI